MARVKNLKKAVTLLKLLDEFIPDPVVCGGGAGLVALTGSVTLLLKMASKKRAVMGGAR